jgi:poly [ADP-ribose] polymerase
MALGKKEAPSGGNNEVNKTVLKEMNSKFVASKHDDSVQNLINFIFDQKLMEESVVSMNYDIKKLPLGELSKETILKGYQILSQIE